MTVTEKICNTCGLIKPLSDYYKSSCNNKYGVMTSCKVCTKDRVKKNTDNNKDKIKEYQKQYGIKNRDKLNAYIKDYRDKNKEKINKQRLIKRKNNPILNLQSRIRNLIRMTLKRKGYTKRSRSYTILGCSYQELLNYLNNNPYNFVFEYGKYDIDHIIPISTAITEEDVIKLNHYTNLQLLPKIYNQTIKKDNPWDKKHFELWLENNPT